MGAAWAGMTLQLWCCCRWPVTACAVWSPHVHALPARGKHLRLHQSAHTHHDLDQH
jgi:hypothetical protein